jgi:hypothetical protein
LDGILWILCFVYLLYTTVVSLLVLTVVYLHIISWPTLGLLIPCLFVLSLLIVSLPALNLVIST